MIRRKRKQIVYNTEGETIVRPDFNIKLIPPKPLPKPIPEPIPEHITKPIPKPIPKPNPEPIPKWKPISDAENMKDRPYDHTGPTYYDPNYSSPIGMPSEPKPKPKPKSDTVPENMRDRPYDHSRPFSYDPNYSSPIGMPSEPKPKPKPIPIPEYMRNRPGDPSRPFSYDPDYRRSFGKYNEPKPSAPIEPIQPFKPEPRPPRKPGKSDYSMRPGDPSRPYYDPDYSRPIGDPNIPPSTNTNPFIKAMTEPDISDAEGLRRAYASPSNTYMFKGVLYVAGTQGGVFSKDMAENMKYIVAPAIKSTVLSTIQQMAKTAVMGLFERESELAVNVGFGIDHYLEKKELSDEMKKSMEPDIAGLTRFKDAETAYLANRNYIHRVVGDSSGGAVIEALKAKYPEIEGGNGYGAPIFDVFGRSRIREFLQEQRESRNGRYGDKWYNQPSKIADNIYQDLLEKALATDSVRSYKETGIDQHRTLGDPIAALNNSAFTSVSSISDILSKNTLTHSYELTASNISTSIGTGELADGYITKDGTPVMFQ